VRASCPHFLEAVDMCRQDAGTTPQTELGCPVGRHVPPSTNLE